MTCIMHITHFEITRIKKNRIVIEPILAIFPLQKEKRPKLILKEHKKIGTPREFSDRGRSDGDIVVVSDKNY